MSDGMGREPAYLSSHATNRYFIPNWGSKLIAERKYGEGMEKNSIEGLVLDFGMLNGYGEKVNGPLIHANQLAFG